MIPFGRLDLFPRLLMFALLRKSAWPSNLSNYALVHHTFHLQGIVWSFPLHFLHKPNLLALHHYHPKWGEACSPRCRP